MRKSKLFLWLALVLTGVSSYAANAPGEDDGVYFTIDRFHVAIDIHEDGSFVVAETISVEFHHKRHGIYREIPFKYKNELGDVVRMPIEVMAVTDEAGAERKNRITHPGNVVNIRIGHPEKYVTGRQVYVITYRVKNGLLFFEDHDELYWNVTGNFWDEPIRSASAAVRLVSDKKSEQLLTGCYTGRYGRRESDCIAETSENGARFNTTRMLYDFEGLTIAFGWDKGIVRPPTDMELFISKYNVAENWVFIIPVIALLFMVVQWFRKGRDPRVRGAVTVMYGPPEFRGKVLTAAEVGSLVDERFDSRDLTASIVGLAVRGYVKIEEIKNEGVISLFDKVNYDLHKLKEPDDTLTPFETQLMSDLFSGAAKVVAVSALKNKFYKNLKPLSRLLWQQLKDKKYFNTSPYAVRAAYIGVGVVIAVAGSIASLWLAHGYTIKGVVAAIVSGLIVMAFSNAMPVKTRAGARAFFHVRGFQEFMNRADKDRLERMGKDIFYKYMPYAIALDVVDHWAEAFEGILDDPPGWYVSAGGFRAFSAVSFSQSLGSAASSLSSATFSAPRGSGVGGSSGGGGGGLSGGGGGGGFSGGGGGGGGGGSW